MSEKTQSAINCDVHCFCPSRLNRSPRVFKLRRGQQCLQTVLVALILVWTFGVSVAKSMRFKKKNIMQNKDCLSSSMELNPGTETIEQRNSAATVY